MNPKTLESIGLTRNESVIYLTLLKTGQSKTGTILKESGLNSGKIYEILESLKRKGLISEAIIDGIKQYAAAPPAQLLEYAAHKKKEIESQEKEIKNMIPQLTTLMNVEKKEKTIVTYTGFRGIITAAEEALSHTAKNEHIRSLGISDMNAWSQDYWMKWEKMRVQKKISAKYILSEKGKIYADLKDLPDIEIKILKAKTPVGIDVYGKNIVLILHYQEPISCTLIYDEHTATTFISYFDILWNTTKNK